LSANQIPPLFPRPREWRPDHDCPACARNGGPGHTLGKLLQLAREEGESVLEVPVHPVPRVVCRYWSAMKLEYCESTDRVTPSGPIWSRRCAEHVLVRRQPSR
jgi:hypothetical protein